MTSASWWRKQKARPWRTEKIYSMHSYDIPDIKWVERFIVGITHPDKFLTQDEIAWQLDRVNRALRTGKLIGIEQNVTMLTDGNKDILTQYTVYHIGFKYRPNGK